jgi:hypothetical protein
VDGFPDAALPDQRCSRGRTNAMMPTSRPAATDTGLDGFAAVRLVPKPRTRFPIVIDRSKWR